MIDAVAANDILASNPGPVCTDADSDGADRTKGKACPVSGGDSGGDTGGGGGKGGGKGKKK